MRWATETVRALRGPQRGWRGARPCCVRGGSWPERSRRSWHRDRQSLDPYSGSDPSEPPGSDPSDPPEFDSASPLGVGLSPRVPEPLDLVQGVTGDIAKVALVGELASIAVRNPPAREHFGNARRHNGGTAGRLLALSYVAVWIDCLVECQECPEDFLD